VGFVPAPPRVLLGDLEPILSLGLVRVLTEEGADVIGQQHEPAEILDTAGRQRPDLIVLDFDSGDSRELGLRVRNVSPETKVIFWARDEGLMEVLDPRSDTTRLVAVAGSEELSREISSSSHAHRVEE
jgi:DNA-binding NarL/FixJ family response regulator